VAGLVAVLDAIAVLETCDAIAVDNEAAERFITGLQRLTRQLDTASEVFEIVVAEGHRPQFTQATVLVVVTA
jgi:hypothetical protein